MIKDGELRSVGSTATSDSVFIGEMVESETGDKIFSFSILTKSVILYIIESIK